MESIKKTFIFIAVISSVLFIQSAHAASKASAEADARLQQVALFKNGLGFFVSQVTCPDKEGSFSFVPDVAVSHGTFWVAYPPKVNLESLIAKEIESPKPMEATTIPELLKANIGRKVRLSLTGEEEKTIQGLIKYFADDKLRPLPVPYTPGRTSWETVNFRGGNLIYGRLIILQTNDAEVAIDPQNVRKVEFLDGQAQRTYTSKDKSMQLAVKLSEPAGGEKLTLSYLAKGITWAPSYIVDITKADKALISAKAAVINEACDLNDVTIQLVTGFPHLQFADIVSPLALKEDLAQFLQSLIRGQSQQGIAGGVMTNVVTQQRVAYAGRRGSEDLMPAYGAADVGKVSEDLFLYPVEHVHLKKAEVAYLPLFTESIPYRHIYQWEIPDYVDEEDRYSYDRRRQEQQQLLEEEVWHCLRLENTTKVPWTTAPAQTVKEGLILGQDTLNYTPVKGETTLRITRAVSVKAEQLELEADRDRDAKQLYGYHYDLVTVDGKLSVTNFQDKTITLEITKTLSGEVESSQPQATIEKLARGLRRMNGVMKLTWTIELKPGENKQLNYVYKVYVRR